MSGDDVEQYHRAALDELQARLERSAQELRALARGVRAEGRHPDRLEGKLAGVCLALSYLAEMRA